MSFLKYSALFCMIVFAPAGGEQATADSPESVAGGEQSAQEYIWVAANIAHPFYTEGIAGWEDAAAHLGVTARLIGPQEADVQQQITMIEQAITEPTTAGLLVYPADYAAVGPVLLKARDLGVPVVVGNGDTEDKSWRDAFVGTDNHALGATAADLAAEALACD